MNTPIEIDKNKPVLITGGSGLVGTALHNRLVNSGFSKVFSLGSKDCNLLNSAKVEDVFSQINPSYVFHLAARVHGLGGNAKYKSDVLVENTIMNLNVIENSRKSDVEKIVAMGSGCVYPDLQNTEELHEEMVWQGAPHPSEDSYGHSKRLMLAHLDAARKQFGLESAFVISGNMYGPFDNFNTEDGHVIPSLVAKFHNAMANGKSVNVWGSGIAIRDFTHANDMAQALEIILSNANGPINAGSGHRHAIRDIVESLQDITGVEVNWDSSKSDGQLVRYYNLDKLFSMGFEPTITLEAGIKDTYNWFATNYPNVRM